MTIDQPTDVELRPWAECDLPLLERLLGDPAATEYIGGPETPEQLRKRHERYCREDADGGGSFAVLVGPDAKAVGWVGFWKTEWLGEPMWEVGWSVLAEYQGLGVATRGATLVIDLARRQMRHRFVHACPSVRNGASNAVCRKLGFTFHDEADVEYPKGTLMRGNDWRLDLLGGDGPVQGA